MKSTIFENSIFFTILFKKINKNEQKNINSVKKKLLAVTRRAGLHNLSSRVIRCSSKTEKNESATYPYF